MRRHDPQELRAIPGGEDMIEYKDIPGHPGYRAGTDGSIWSCWKATGKPLYRQEISSEWKRLKGDPRKEDSRLRYTIRRDSGSYRRTYGSHYVLEAFVGPRPDGQECCHNNGNCLDNASENLRWGTRESNDKDRVIHGDVVMGEKHWKSKLKDADIIEIRKIGPPLKQHAEKYKVTTALISMIIKRKIWKHVI